MLARAEIHVAWRHAWKSMSWVSACRDHRQGTGTVLVVAEKVGQIGGEFVSILNLRHGDGGGGDVKSDFESGHAA